MAGIDIAAVILIMAVLACFVYVYIIVSKANKFRIREYIGNRSIVTDYTMMEKKDRKDQTIYWISVPWQKKIKVYAPPLECMDVSNKGKKYLEAYKLSEDEFCFIKDNGYSKDSEVVKQQWKPFTTTQRGVLVSQLEKAIEQRQKSFWRPEFVVPTVSIIALVVIIMGLLVFYGDIAQPALESHQLALSVQKQNLEIARELDLKVSGETVQVASEPLSIPLADELGDILPNGR